MVVQPDGGWDRQIKEYDDHFSYGTIARIPSSPMILAMRGGYRTLEQV